MALTKYKLGELLRYEDERNSEGFYSLSDVKGISIQKIFIETKANMEDVSLSPYILVKPDFFAYVTVTSRNGEKITLAHNTTEGTYIVSSSYVVFSILNPRLLNSDYLFMYFNRPEFDRFSRFNSWGSARETFSWEDLCDIDIELPPLPIQQKYVDVYNAMLANQQSYERGLEDLKTAFTILVENLKKKYPLTSFMDYIKERTEVNEASKYTKLVGVGNSGFIDPKGNREISTFHKCNIFYPKDFVYNPSVIMKGAIAFNDAFDTPMICTEEYIVFYVSNELILLPEYLYIWLRREETGRFLEFYNIDSVRNRVYFRDLHVINIPITSLETQKVIVDIFKAYQERKAINERMKAQIKDICPILIKGSIEEAQKEV